MSMLEPVNSKTKQSLKMPPEFRYFPMYECPSARPFINYLKYRGFDNYGDIRICLRIRYCVEGYFKNRIIFPIVHEDKLVSWTGRSISKRNPVRYLSLTANHERARELGTSQAIGPINDYLLWHDDLTDLNCHTIVLTEGPFDALKVNVLGNPHGICATCFFTNTPSRKQIELLHGLLPRFGRHILLLDQGTLSIAIWTASVMKNLGIEFKTLPTGVKDPGDLSTTNQLLETIGNNS